MRVLRNLMVSGLFFLLLAGCLWEPVSEGTSAAPVELSQNNSYTNSVGRLSSSYYVVVTDSTGIYIENTQGDALDLELWIFPDISFMESKDPTEALIVIPIAKTPYLDLDFGMTVMGRLYFRIDSKAPVVGQKYSITIN